MKPSNEKSFLTLLLLIIDFFPSSFRTSLSINSQVLLTSDKAAANFSDRSLLKNLGHWLGMITLAKNKPILYTVSMAHSPTSITGGFLGTVKRVKPAYANASACKSVRFVDRGW